MNSRNALRVACALMIAALLSFRGASLNAQPSGVDQCIAPLTYFALDGSSVGYDADGKPALGTYERVSPDGRFILRSYSGAKVGTVSLMELPRTAGAPIRVYRTPFSNEAFPVQGSWRYLVDVSGQHYRFSEVLRDQAKVAPLFRAGMTGFYAAASELQQADQTSRIASDQEPIYIRSLSWPQNADSDSQGVGPLQLETIVVRDDGRHARVERTTGARFICGDQIAKDGGVFALPMISVDGSEFSAIPQSPKQGQPSMRVYGLDRSPLAINHSCDLRADLGLSPSKAVFGYSSRTPAAPWLTYSDLGSVYVFDRQLNQSFRLDQGRDRTLVSAFPALTRDGRVVYGATWRECATAGRCTEQAGYVIADPYQSHAYKAYWQKHGNAAPKACITQAEVDAEYREFARMHGIAP